MVTLLDYYHQPVSLSADRFERERWQGEETNLPSSVTNDEAESLNLNKFVTKESQEESEEITQNSCNKSRNSSRIKSFKPGVKQRDGLDTRPVSRRRKVSKN